MKKRELKDELTIQRLILERIEFSVSKRLPGHFLQDAEVSTYIEFVADSMVAKFKAYLYGRESETERIEKGTLCFPDTWFQMLKRDVFPAALLRWFPVKYHDVEFAQKIVTRTLKVCPHLNVKSQQYDHLEFFIREGL